VSPTGKEPSDSTMKLVPHQTALVETFFNPASKRVILLRGDVGLGKSAALVALTRRLLQERPMARALFLVPGVLRTQFVEMLYDTGTRALLVDRYHFREMLDSTTEGEFWPRGVVAVLSREFAKQADILDSLVGARWDLVVADEAHTFAGPQAANALRRVAASAERVILASATVPDPRLSDAFPADDVTVVEWRRARVVDHDGTPLDTLPRPLLQEVAFSLSPAELSLFETVGTLCRVFEGGTPQQGWIAKSLLRSLQSSPAALEGALQRLAERLGTQESLELPLESSDEEVLEDQSDGHVDQATAVKATKIIVDALQEIEAVGSDSKLGAFIGLLSRLDIVKMPSKRICVLTEFLGTLYYLAAEIESQGIACQLLHGGMGAEDRRRSVPLFSSAGGILVTTRAATEGITLSVVTDLVLYDVPDSKSALEQALGRFDRFGRQSRLNVHAFAPSNRAHVLTPEPLLLLREILGSAPGAQPTH